MAESRFCPNCGSIHVEPDTRHTNVLGEAMFNTNKWVCNDCGYTGIMPSGTPEDFDEDVDEIDFEPTQQPTIDTWAGKAYFKYIAYILIPALTLYIIYHFLFSA